MITFFIYLGLVTAPLTRAQAPAVPPQLSFHSDVELNARVERWVYSPALMGDLTREMYGSSVCYSSYLARGPGVHEIFVGQNCTPKNVGSRLTLIETTLRETAERLVAAEVRLADRFDVPHRLVAEAIDQHGLGVENALVPRRRDHAPEFLKAIRDFVVNEVPGGSEFVEHVDAHGGYARRTLGPESESHAGWRARVWRLSAVAWVTRKSEPQAPSDEMIERLGALELEFGVANKLSAAELERVVDIYLNPKKGLPWHEDYRVSHVTDPSTQMLKDFDARVKKMWPLFSSARQQILYDVENVPGDRYKFAGHTIAPAAFAELEADIARRFPEGFAHWSINSDRNIARARFSALAGTWCGQRLDQMPAQISGPN